jgi:DNA-binding response OmpR family regulator
MTSEQDLIWILDSDPACVSLYQQTLGLQYLIQSFKSVDRFMNTLASIGNESPRLLIADPENTPGSLVDSLQKAREIESKSLKLPEFLIASRIDDLDIIRFYLKAGARDYILKPLRPNELVAKVEKSLHQISNREILILRNDLDGIQVTDLTFREHQMLTIFLSRTDRKVKRDELYAAIWGKVNVNKKTLDVHLFNLRRKIRPYDYDIICQDQIFSLQKHVRT